MEEATIVLSWKNLNVLGPISRTERQKYKDEGRDIKQKVILNNLEGRFDGGTFTAIMGASGCGKTTLLNFLSRRQHYLRGLTVTGDLLVNGIKASEVNFHGLTAYVMQEDVLMGTMTVRESLEFIARLRLKADVWEERIDRVVQGLELMNCQYNRIGSELEKGISGGEKKRVSVALELLTAPKLLFLDEPTTGLDSHSAETLIDILNRIKQLGITTVCTIHQPNSFIFSKFENLILMSKGQIIYQGQAMGAVEHFNSLGYKCPEYANPAEHFIDLLSGQDDDQDFVQRLVNIQENPLNLTASYEQTPIPKPYERDASLCLQLQYLCWRSFLNIRRSKMLIPFKIATGLVFVVITLVAYFQVAAEDDAQSVMDRAGFIFFYTVLMSFVAVQSSGAYAEERAMFVREQANKTYLPGLYYLSKLLIDVPVDLVISALFAFLVYFIVGLSLENASQIFVFVGVMILQSIQARGMGNFLVIAIENPQAAAGAGPFFIIIQLLFAGLFINYDDIPDYLIPIHYISSLKYTWSSCMLNEFDTWDEDDCGTDAICDPEDYYSIDIDFGINVMALCILMVGVHVAAFLCLIRLANRFRH